MPLCQTGEKQGSRTGRAAALSLHGGSESRVWAKGKGAEDLGKKTGSSTESTKSIKTTGQRHFCRGTWQCLLTYRKAK